VVAALTSAPISGTLSQKRGDESIAPRFSQQRSVDWTYRQRALRTLFHGNHGILNTIVQLACHSTWGCILAISAGGVERRTSEKRAWMTMDALRNVLTRLQCPLGVDTVEKVSAKEMWNWNLKQRNPAS
jgi:hypothetical protein